MTELQYLCGDLEGDSTLAWTDPNSSNLFLDETNHFSVINSGNFLDSTNNFSVPQLQTDMPWYLQIQQTDNSSSFAQGAYTFAYALWRGLYALDNMYHPVMNFCYTLSQEQFVYIEGFGRAIEKFEPDPSFVSAGVEFTKDPLVDFWICLKFYIFAQYLDYRITDTTFTYSSLYSMGERVAEDFCSPNSELTSFGSFLAPLQFLSYLFTEGGLKLDFSDVTVLNNLSVSSSRNQAYFLFTITNTSPKDGTPNGLRKENLYGRMRTFDGSDVIQLEG